MLTLTFTGTNQCQCPLEHVPTINTDIKNCNLCRLLVQQTSTLQQVHLCIWGISPSKLWLKMFWIMAFSVVLEKRWSWNYLRIQWCWGWLWCWRSADVQLASCIVWQSAKEGFHLLNCEQRLLWVNDSIQTVYTEAILCIHYIFLSHMLTTVRTLQGQYWQTRKGNLPWVVLM